jgi:hypothetical protein
MLRGERARAFRAVHAVGQRVAGRFLERDASGLCWFSFDGLPMLADIEGEPASGSVHSFVIQSLHPDIVLKEVPREGGGGAGAGCGAGMVRDFDSMRNAFEAEAAPVLRAFRPETHHPAERREMLFGALRPEDRERYLLAATAQAAINARLAESGPTRLLYLPWLVARALRQDLVLRTQRKEDGTRYEELSFGCVPEGCGPLLVRVLSREDAATGERRASLRVFPERPAMLAPARAVLRALGRRLDPSMTLLGAEKPLKYLHGGVLSELLAADPHALHGLGG